MPIKSWYHSFSKSDWNELCEQQRDATLREFSDVQCDPNTDEDIPAIWLSMLLYASILMERDEDFMSTSFLKEMSEKKEDTITETFNTRTESRNMHADEFMYRAIGHLTFRNIDKNTLDWFSVKGNDIIPYEYLYSGSTCHTHTPGLRGEICVKFENVNDLSEIRLEIPSRKNNYWGAVVSSLLNVCTLIVGYINELLYQNKYLKEMSAKVIDDIQYGVDENADTIFKIRIHTELLRNARENLRRVCDMVYAIKCIGTGVYQREVITLKAGVPSLYGNICLLWQPLHPQSVFIQNFHRKSVIYEHVNKKKFNFDARDIIPKFIQMIDYYTKNKKVDRNKVMEFSDLLNNELQVYKIIDLPVD